MRRPWIVAALAAALLAPALALASHHHAVKPEVGQYEGDVQNVPTYRPGAWSVGKVHGKLKILPAAATGAIDYPDANRCEASTTSALSVTQIPISKRATFFVKDSGTSTSFRGQTHKIRVKWSGHWKSKHTLHGSIQIKWGHCTTKRTYIGYKTG